MGDKLGYKTRRQYTQMSQLIFTENAVQDLERLRTYLDNKNALIAKRLSKTLIGGMEGLRTMPHLGPLMSGLNGKYRRWIIEFGSHKYIVSYRVEGDDILILSIHHERENRPIYTLT